MNTIESKIDNLTDDRRSIDDINAKYFDLALNRSVCNLRGDVEFQLVSRPVRKKYTAIIEKSQSGWYIAQCEQVPGALTQGKTIEEVQENLKEAIAFVLESEYQLGITTEKYDEILIDDLVNV